MKWTWYADLGNCTLHWGAWAQDAWCTSARVSVQHLRTPNGLQIIKEKLAQSNLAPSDCQQAVLCASAPAIKVFIDDFVRKLLRAETKVMGTDFQADIATEYYDPAQVGQDRLANALAAVKLYGTPVIVVDFGSCLTCDAISAEGVFVGGAIAPGLSAYQHGIEGHTPHLTASLSEVVGTKQIPAQQPGRSTAECLSVGIYYGLAGAADRLVQVMRQYLAQHAPVIATGGDAESIVPLCETEMTIAPMLTLDGLRVAYSSGPM